MESFGCLERVAPRVQSSICQMQYQISDDDQRYTIQVRLLRIAQEVSISHIEVPSYFPGSKVEIILANINDDPNRSSECRQIFTIPSAYTTKTFEIQREYKLLSIHFPVAIISPKRGKTSALHDSADLLDIEGARSPRKRGRKSASASTTPPLETTGISKSAATAKRSDSPKTPSPKLRKQRTARPSPGPVILRNPDMTKENYPQLHRHLPAHRDVKFMPQRNQY